MNNIPKTEETENFITEAEIHRNPFLAMTVEGDSKLKKYIVEYVGTHFDEEDVTVNMIAELLATEFPEFIFSLAEENFLRGYQTGLDDAYKTFTAEAKEPAGEQ